MTTRHAPYSDSAYVEWCIARGFDPYVIGGDPAVLHRIYVERPDSILTIAERRHTAVK